MTTTVPTDHGKAYWRAPITAPDFVKPVESTVSPSELAQLAEFMPMLCWIARSDGYIFWYNLRWHDYCGSQPDQMAGWGWQSVHDPVELPGVLTKWTAAINAGVPFEMTFPLRGADGVFRPFLTRAIPIRNGDGTIARWFGTNAEIAAQVEAERALQASEAKYQVLTNAMPQMVWSTLPDGFHDYYNAQWYEFTGVPEGSTDGEAWNGVFHSEDRDRAMETWRHSLATGEFYQIQYRLRHRSGDYRWVLGRAQPVHDESGQIVRWIGTCTDINEAKKAAEQNELLSRELSHRIKNIFAVISGLISLSARRTEALKPALGDLLGRISALARAHDFARPHSPESMPNMGVSSLHGLLKELFRPYRDEQDQRIVVAGDDVPIDDRSATPIALVIHELATNSAKYGALSKAEGWISVNIACADDDLSIDWLETGGPKLAGIPKRTGFGTELAEIGVARQLGGTIDRDWRATGLRVKIEVKASRLHRHV